MTVCVCVSVTVHTQIILTFSISLLLCVIFLFFSYFQIVEKWKIKKLKIKQKVLFMKSSCVNPNIIFDIAQVIIPIQHLKKKKKKKKKKKGW